MMIITLLLWGKKVNKKQLGTRINLDSGAKLFFIKVESFINFTEICNFHENIAYDNAVNRIGGGKRYA